MYTERRQYAFFFALFKKGEQVQETLHMIKNTTPRQDISPSRRNPLPLLMTGLLLGLIVGAPLGWFSHQLFFRYRSAQVLLCRQQHFGQPEVELQRLCGSLY
ncbi:hypothetical protein ACF3DV_02625 [Chlorogloeopsis fritschii PCC 9212]|jgi:hypothetical protein|uniref:hypothetical protein n=2 Tax=Chlorogloeopsis fritschii TaxID=1124 RepID=UPI001F20FFA0|nr:hypothetical protein [Chlorogloeopsis fritschii]